MFDLRQFQYDVDDWHKANFPQEADESTLVLVEEVGELARAVIKGRQNVRGGQDRWREEKAKEAGDVLISLLAFCNQNGIDLAAATTVRWKTVGNRVASSAEEQAR